MDFPNLPYCSLSILFDKAAQAFRLAPALTLRQDTLSGKGFAAAFASAAPSFVLTTYLWACRCRLIR
jgi:hypothetical protein